MEIFQHSWKILCIILTVMLVVLLSIYPQDNVGIVNPGNKIVNTNGNEWELTGANIQLAIDDLDSGTVFVGGNVDLSEPIKLKHDVHVDFLNNYVTLKKDTTFIFVEECRNAGARNCNVNLYPQQTEPAIHLYISGGWGTRIRHNVFENIYLFNKGGKYQASTENWLYNYHDYDAILFEHVGDASFLENTFRQITIEGCKSAIRFYQPGHSTGWGNSNTFRDMWVDQFETMIDFDVDEDVQWGFNDNHFENVKGQATDYTRYGVKNVSKEGNHFVSCLIFDWYVTSDDQPYDWIIRSDAYETFICSHFIKILDEAPDTTYCGD